MARTSTFGEVELDVSLGKERIAEEDPETPFRILLAGDFSGHPDRGALATRPVSIDRDNFDQILAQIAPAIELPRVGRIAFSDIDDFHPDQLYDRLSIFQALREARARLKNPDTYAAAVTELRGPASTPAPAPPAQMLSSANLLDQMVEETESRTSAGASRAVDPLRSYIQALVAPYLVPKPDPKQAEWIALVDEASSALMRAILSHQLFQALEAAWRAVFLLVRNLETDEHLRLYLLDVSKSDLAADLLPAKSLRETALYRILVRETVATPGAEPWALVAGNYRFNDTLEDVELLGRLALIAKQARAPLLAEADSRIVGCEALADCPDHHQWKQDTDGAWDLLRQIPEAGFLGLALPRILLRLPYGRDTEPAERFAFEEIADGPRHDSYLWGNPAFACALLLGQSFSQIGWALRPGVVRDLTGLPLHVYKEGGEAKVKPCAETLLLEEAIERIIDRGLIPFASWKDRDLVRVVRFQSIAYPAAPLAGRWS